MGRKENLRDDTVLAFEESTGDLPNDYEMAVINIKVDEYLDTEPEQQ